jgi:hypothetical protein
LTNTTLCENLGGAVVVLKGRRKESGNMGGRGKRKEKRGKGKRGVCEGMEEGVGIGNEEGNKLNGKGKEER